MKRNLLILLSLAITAMTSAIAQSLSITSMVELNDLDARAYEPILDQNGKKCAILKIVTTEQGFTFDVGALGVRKVVYKPAEIWVYVPPQTSKIKIAHPKLGQLDTEDGYYWFPIGGVREATCYRLKLVSGRLITTVEAPTVQTGYLLITTEPDGAEVYLTDEKGMENFVGTTPFQKRMPYGDYRFRLEKPLYYSEPGIAHVNSDRAEYPIRLRPKFGTLQINTIPAGAKVVLEDIEHEYITPCTIEKIPVGEREVRITKEGYTTVVKEVDIESGKTATLSVSMDARFAAITIQTLQGASIYIDGKRCGTTYYTDNLTEGIYEVEVRKVAHKSVKKQLQVVAKQPQTMTIEPTPIYGSLDVMTTPWDAQLSLNGESKGATPQFIEKLLIGEYTMRLTKEGYEPVTKKIVIEEGETLIVEETLQQHGRPTTSSSAAQPAHREQAQKPVKEEVKHQKPGYDTSFFFTLNGGIRFKTIPSIGLTLGQEIRRGGWYCTFATGFGGKAFRANYTCDSFGRIDGVTPIYTGKQDYARLSFVGGGMFRMHPSVAMYAGLGYGYNSVAWQLQNGQWARYADYTVQGLDIQLGMHFNIKGFVLRTGINTTNFKTFEMSVGIGGAIKKK